jgi:hypothetical protein
VSGSDWARHWASLLVRLDREDDCSSRAEQLLAAGSAADRRAGVDFAVEAMRAWRAAPARLTPTLVGEPFAVHALCASLTATRSAADHLATLLDDAESGTAVAIALGCVGDRRAVPYLVPLMHSDDSHRRLAEALAAVASPDLVAEARQVLVEHRDPCRPADEPWQYCPAVPAMHLLATLGPAAAAAVPELVERLRGVTGAPGYELLVLQRIGPAAQAAVPVIRQLPGDSTLALSRITLDRAVADRHLAELPERFRRGHLRAPLLLTWLAEHGGLDERERTQLRSLFAYPGASQVRSARALWLTEGPAVADELLAELPKYLDDDVFGPEVLEVFDAMGPYARPVLGHLDDLISARARIGVHLGDADAEMRADEVLLGEARTVRERIAASTR